MSMAWRQRIGGWFTAELLFIWGLGSWAVWYGGGERDALLRSASVLGGVACLLAWYAMGRRPPTRLADWQGSLQFVACWTNFVLFKAIRLYWIAIPADYALLALDRWLFGGRSLPEHFFRLEQPWLSETLSAGYFMFYFVVLLPVLWFTVRRASDEAKDFFAGLSAMYLVGFAGYLRVPAGGPCMAHPEVFPYPVAGGAMTAFLTQRVAEGITGMDVFPSLHAGIGLYVCGFFATGRRRHPAYRWLAAALAPVVAAIILATIYLRYHYGIDLLAGLLLGWGAIHLVRHQRRKEMP